MKNHHVEIRRNTDHYHLLLSSLKKVITNDYILLDLPYYANVGDVLIWEATIQLLKKIRYRCLYSCSIDTYRKPRIKKNTILLFSGGGNFGDLWDRHQEFRHQVMEDFPENPVVQLPQSVWFGSKENMFHDVSCFAKHKAPVTICLRDQQSFDTISNNYKNTTPLLLPDLVLSLNIDKVLKRNRICRQPGDGTLYFKRDDKEYVENNLNFTFDAMGDWPCRNYTIKWVLKHDQLMEKLEHIKTPQKIRLKITQWYYRYIIKDAYLRNGIRFLMPYQTIYATRLHAAILGVLLDKKVFILDNSYHKCSGVYNLWMKDWSNIKPIYNSN